MPKEKKCTKCGEVKGLECFSKHKGNPDGLQYSCKECSNRSSKTYRQDNPKYLTNYYQSNLNYLRDYYKKYHQDNQEAMITRVQKWAKENPDKNTAKTAKRRARMRNATPKWLTEEQDLQIKLLYKEAKELEEADGVKRHVDHIVPLKGKGVRGLHVPWNLQILTAEQNLSKNSGYSDWGDYVKA